MFDDSGVSSISGSSNGSSTHCQQQQQQQQTLGARSGENQPEGSISEKWAQVRMESQDNDGLC